MKDIQIENEVKVWDISFQKEEIFKLASIHTLYDVDRAENNKDINILLDDDRIIFKQFLDIAISKLTILLARRISKDGVKVSNDTITYYLIMSNNHDDNILPSLITYCKNYIVRLILEMWFKKDCGSTLIEGEIIHTLEYRKHSPARKVRNFL